MNLILETSTPMHPAVREITFARVDDDFNSKTAERVKEQLSSVLAGSGNVVLDLRKARLDSVGLSALLSLQRKLELQERGLFVVTGDPRFHSLLQNAGVLESLALFPDLDSAINGAHQAPPSLAA